MNPGPGGSFDPFEHDYYERLDACLRSLGGRDGRYYSQLKIDRLLQLSNEYLGGIAGRSFLDLGCGLGRAAKALAAAGGVGVGMDLSGGMLRAAGASPPGCFFVRGNSGRLPFQDRAFDLCFSMTFLHHLDAGAYARMIAESKRVLKPGGLTVHFDHNPCNPLARKVAATCEFDVGESVVLRTMNTVAASLTNEGFTVLVTGYIAFMPAALKFLEPAERFLRFLPLGAQYFVAATF